MNKNFLLYLWPQRAERLTESKYYISNPAEGSDGRSTVNVLLASHVFGQAVKHNKGYNLTKNIF